MSTGFKGAAMKTGKELAIEAMKKDFNRLSRAADRAKNEADERINITIELIAIHQEFVKIAKSDENTKEILKKLDSLQGRKKNAEKIRKKDLLKLIDKQSFAEINRDSLGQEIQMMEFKLS